MDKINKLYVNANSIKRLQDTYQTVQDNQGMVENWMKLCLKKF